MTTKRIPRYCATCKKTTAHEVAGRYRKCVVCGKTIEKSHNQEPIGVAIPPREVKP